MGAAGWVGKDGHVAGSGFREKKFRAFKPLEGSPAKQGRVDDPVRLISLTRSGDSEHGWTLSAEWTGGEDPYTAVCSPDAAFGKGVRTLGMELPGQQMSFGVAAGEPGIFFNVVDGSTVSPAVQGLGYDPLPPPKVTGVSVDNNTVDSVWWGDTATFSGRYFSPIAVENLAFMYDLPVRGKPASTAGGSQFADSVGFVVPPDARAFLAGVATYGKWDATGAPTVYMSPPDIGPYTGITGVSWAPQTGKIWVAASGVIEKVDLFKLSPHARTVISGEDFQPYISRVTTDGEILMIDRQFPAQIVVFNVESGNQDTFASTSDDGFSRGLHPVGLAVDPLPAVLPYEGKDNVGWADPAFGLSAGPNGPWESALDVSLWACGTGVERGCYTAYLKVPERYSGDNFQIEITKAMRNTFGEIVPLPERVVAMTSVYTSWKRIFIERDKMFRRGGVLAEDYVPVTDCGSEEHPICDCIANPHDDCCNGTGPLRCNQIRVYEWTNVETNDWIVIFDEWAGNRVFSFFFDRLLPVRPVTAIGAVNEDGLRILTLDSPLHRPFTASLAEPDLSGSFQPLFCDQNGENCAVSGFGVVYDCDLDANQINSVNSCFYSVDLRGVERAFGDAFVDVLAPREGRNFLPTLTQDWFSWEETYEKNHPDEQWFPIDFFSWEWFGNAGEDNTNYRQFLAVSSDEGPFSFGLTRPLFRRTLLFRRGVELWGGLQDPPATLSELDNFTQDVCNHELGHHFFLQRCSEGGHHNDVHNPKSAWCGPPWSDPGVCPYWASEPELCLMNSGSVGMEHSQGWDPVFRFCEECLFLGDSDPGDVCNNDLRGGSIRTGEDPLP